MKYLTRDGVWGSGSVTLVAGLSLITFAELLLFCVDLPSRQWQTIPMPHNERLPPPQNWVGELGRRVALNMTPLCWIGYLLAFDGLLTKLGRLRGRPQLSCIRARPNRFIWVWLASIPLWCYFDWINFNHLHAWRYHGLPEEIMGRYAGYFIAFAAICPGMFLAAQCFSVLGAKKARSKPLRIGPSLQASVLLAGVACSVYPFIVNDPIGNLTLWVSLLFLLDPINHWMGSPSITGDWQAGRWGRTLSLMAGGLFCGLCWEFWNYWALAKWTYDLPFVGQLQSYRYFEMPWIGFLGFAAFPVECWVTLNFLEGLLARTGIYIAEPMSENTIM